MGHRLAFTLVQVVVLGLVTGCGSGDERDDGTGGAGPASPEGCAVSEQLLSDGTCLPAGLTANECAEGFVGDGLGGCAPQLPVTPCEDGTTATPGDVDCRPLADCGEGAWGLIEVDGSTVYVDASATGGDGSAMAPFATISEGVAAAAPGATVAVAAGTYTETVTVGDKPLTLWGRCPSMVDLDAETTAGILVEAGSPVTVRGFGITGLGNGVIVRGEASLTDLWIHDTTLVGVLVDGGFSEARAVMDDVHIARVIDVGVLALGGEVDGRDVVIRDVDRLPSGEFGRGWDIEEVNGRRGALTLDGGVIERAFEHGVYVSGSDADLRRVVVRDVVFNTLENPGFGITARMNDAGTPSNLVLADAVIERTVAAGIRLSSAATTLERLVVRDVAAGPDGRQGYGVAYTTGEPTMSPSFALRRALIERSTTAAVLGVGVHGVVEGLLARDILPEPSSGFFGRALDLGSGPVSTPGGTSVTVAHSRIERVYDSGIAIFTMNAAIDDVAIDGVGLASDGSFGDGIDVFGGSFVPTVSVTRSLVRGGVRAGIANFVANVQLLDNRIGCNGIDLNGEDGSSPFVFDDQGGNVCGCETEEPCKVLSTDLAPPGTPQLPE